MLSGSLVALSRSPFVTEWCPLVLGFKIDLAYKSSKLVKLHDPCSHRHCFEKGAPVYVGHKKEVHVVMVFPGECRLAGRTGMHAHLRNDAMCNKKN